MNNYYTHTTLSYLLLSTFTSLHFQFLRSTPVQGSRTAGVKRWYRGEITGFRVPGPGFRV